MKTQTLINSLREGRSSKAIRQLYQHFPPIRSFILKHGGNQDDAKDIFQESLLIFCKNVRKPDFTLTCAPGTYLYSVSRYLWKAQLKRQNRQVSWDEEADSLPLDVTQITPQEEEAKLKQLDRVLKQIGDKCLRLLKSYYFERQSMKEIAQEFGFRTVNSAKTQKYKCLQRAKTIAGNLQLTKPNK